MLSFFVAGVKLFSQTVQMVACGGFHVIAVVAGATSSETYSWGSCMSGQLGHGDFQDRAEPTVLAAMRGKQVNCIAAGAAHSAVVVM